MESTDLTIDRSISPARLLYEPTFNAASWYVDRHLRQGRGAKLAIRQDGVDVTYAELAAHVGRAGNALSGLALEVGDRVLMVVQDCPEFFYFFWGAIKAGFVPVPVSFLMRAPDIAHMITDSGCRAVVYSPEFAPEVVKALVSTGTGAQGLRLETDGFLDEMAAAPSALAPNPSGPEDVAFWLYSSGTTGRPKGVPHRHRNLIATCEHYAVGVLGLTEDDRCFSAAKLFFAYGLGNAMTFPLHVGGTAILDERRPSPASTFETVERFAPTVYFGVPTLYAAQLAALDSGTTADLRSLRLCVSAGEALPPDLFHRWKASTGLEILDGIGSTEALHIFISNVAGSVQPGATGRVVPGYEARVVTESGEEAAPGESGQLEIRGDSITPGYWDRPKQGQSTFVEGWLRTGDEYIRDERGVFRYRGRADDMIKVGGIWCSPFEMEARLVEHAAVLEAAVVGRKDEHELVKPEAHVVLVDELRETVGAASARDALEAELVAHCQADLPPYMYPRWIHFVSDLPRTATGKIQRYRLRKG